MSGPRSTVDRPMPSVAIVGTDAVLAAAPATPVQLAHACLRRGYTVAVPASWGDELVASETVRRLKTRDRGPAVMCVCPLARARLLGPGPDLAPFLVSLVSPPVAVARYLRSAYGAQTIRITYIGSCPGADDPDIDARITPDAFVAELAEHGISLSEQPLVFDSIVPPDRRRWCSLPGGVPNADVLWADTDGRSLVEVDRDDVTTELAQHILAREHVLLDLAPGLGCACSGAVGAVTPDRARATVVAGEPPRALSAVIDPAAVVSLDLPVTLAGSPPPYVPTPPVHPPAGETDSGESTLERVLDELLGAGTAPDSEPATPGSGHESAIIVDLPDAPPLPEATAENVADTAPTPPDSAQHPSALVNDPSVPELVIEPAIVAVMPRDTGELPGAASGPTDDRVVTERNTVADESLGDVHATAVPTLGTDEPVEGREPREPRDLQVRRRTPSAMLRYAGSVIPKATVASGKPLPRAYVAKRRTPPAGATAVSVTASPPAGHGPAREGSDAPTPAVTDASVESAPVTTSPPPPAAEQPSPNTATAAPGNAATRGRDTSDTAAGNFGAASASVRPAPHPALVFLLVTALVALAVFVLLTLQR